MKKKEISEILGPLYTFHLSHIQRQPKCDLSVTTGGLLVELQSVKY